ncbi:hypothetical protein Taro_051863 [Colocasia esculenta]|uniref:WRKY domain-containing protein n=1 Tax=Colocasia esculenta TaxID=4460 RepID=A0A843XIB1_COLES|nr:hypothetical protein [Colocasia esculenta]
MEGGGGGSCRDLNRLISELTQGKELTRQLESHMEQLSSPTEQCKHLVQSLLSTWDKAISMARWSRESEGERLTRSLSGSPGSEGSEGRASKDQLESREMFKKRKTLLKITQRVRVDLASTGLEGSLDDGFSWRKYGQKDILGAKHPRSYYRCTHRHSQGCPALKLVQRSDDDPSVFDVTYRGRHTCVQGDNIAADTSTAAAVAADQQQQEVQEHPHPQGNAADESLLLDFRRGQLTVKTEGLSDASLFPFPSPSPSFSFPSTPVGWASPPAAALDSPFTGGFSPQFVSPRASSDPTGFPAPRGQLGGWQAPPAPGPDFADVFCTGATSSSSDLFMLDSLESDPNFPFHPSFGPNQFH